MQNLIRNITVTVVFLGIITSVKGQDRQTAEKAVTTYMLNQKDSYFPSSFGEFFDQTYPNEVQQAMGTNRPVTWSIVHSYSLNGKDVKDEYFHLDADLNVVGHLSFQKMTDIAMNALLNGSNMQLFDSLGIDTTKLK